MRGPLIPLDSARIHDQHGFSKVWIEYDDQEFYMMNDPLFFAKKPNPQDIAVVATYSNQRVLIMVVIAHINTVSSVRCEIL